MHSLTIISILSCGKEENPISESISLVSITVDGTPLVDGAVDVASDATIAMTFSKSVSTLLFENAILITSDGVQESVEVSYSNNSSVALVRLNLTSESEGRLRLAGSAIGSMDEILDNNVDIRFTIAADNNNISPCNNTPQCLETAILKGSSGDGEFSFYSNFPIFDESLNWWSFVA